MSASQPTISVTRSKNQAVVIAAYAQAHRLTIVRTYADKGESGLKLRNRDGLIRLLDDAWDSVWVARLVNAFKEAKPSLA
jgi:hypothetical protein